MIYLDSCILIYALEDQGRRGEVVRKRLRETTAPVVVSPLVAMECLVGPLKDGNHELRDRYTAALDRLEQVDLDLAVFLRAAELRAATGLRTPRYPPPGRRSTRRVRAAVDE